MIKSIDLIDLHPHPGNPRLAPREDVVEQIAAQLNGQLDEAHALIVRPNGTGYQIISGHHRQLAAAKAGLSAVPCWVREMSDEDAYMALALNNAQGELHPLEVGLHALRSGKEPKAYADLVGQPRTSIQTRISSARVAAETDIGLSGKDRWSQLAEIHAAPRWLWHALVAAMLDQGWTVDVTRKEVKAVAETPLPPEWADAETIADRIVEGAMRSDAVAKFQRTIDDAKERLALEGLAAELDANVAKAKPALLSELTALCKVAIDKQAEHDKQARDEALAQEREKEAVETRAARLRSYVSLDEWKSLDDATKRSILAFTSKTAPSFNKQENADIEWAQWSWNPITGCLHDCPYCYARDIANQKRMAAVYPNGFAPTLRPMHLLAPHTQKPPKEAATDARYKNVFTGSMADMFGRWVPEEWIDAVLTQMRAAPQWNFLCLTKFPKRMAEFEIPQNTWMGTTVDLQARVPAAEAAFAKVKCAVKWLSVEPMLEPLQFTNLSQFDWIVIGGASRQAHTPEWHPPSQWIVDLRRQAEDAGVAVYEKTNLWSDTTPRTLQLPRGLPVRQDDGCVLPDVFKYLGRAKTADQKPE